MRRAWSSFELDHKDPIAVGTQLHGGVQISLGAPKSDVRITLSAEQAEELRVKLDLHLRSRAMEEHFSAPAAPKQSATVSTLRPARAPGVVDLPYEGKIP